jgi:hypothetical protein
MRTDGSPPISEWSALRHGPMQGIRQATTGPLPPVSAVERGLLSHRIESIAVAVAWLPKLPLTTGQRQDLRTIARELQRLSQS